MAENESLDLGSSYSQRWEPASIAVQNGDLCDKVAPKVSKALYGGLSKALNIKNTGHGSHRNSRQFRKSAIPPGSTIPSMRSFWSDWIKRTSGRRPWPIGARFFAAFAGTAFTAALFLAVVLAGCTLAASARFCAHRFRTAS